MGRPSMRESSENPREGNPVLRHDGARFCIRLLAEGRHEGEQRDPDHLRCQAAGTLQFWAFAQWLSEGAPPLPSPYGHL
jgi:hypothetical protein